MAGAAPQGEHWPSEVRLERAAKRLHVSFESGESFAFAAEFLRVESPSAEVQGHGPGQHQLVVGRAHVGIMEIEPVGNYAIKIVFDDLHDTGIYSWDYLYGLGQQQEEIWQSYLDQLEAKGLSREP
ncbi:MAG: gamma-butyrobetaine hydroxylase-like domain-containing protein [Alphaproteobacteria bacterium]